MFGGKKITDHELELIKLEIARRESEPESGSATFTVSTEHSKDKEPVKPLTQHETVLKELKEIKRLINYEVRAFEGRLFDKHVVICIIIFFIVLIFS